MLFRSFCARAFSSCGKRGPLFIAVHGPLTIVASLVGSTDSRRAGSVSVAHGPSCSAACGIFPDQGSNPCPLHWQADSQPLRHQGSPGVNICPAKGACWLFLPLLVLGMESALGHSSSALLSRKEDGINSMGVLSRHFVEQP